MEDKLNIYRSQADLVSTQLIKIDRKNPDFSVLKIPAAIISKGGLAAFPTETVYGLGGDALNPESAKKIYTAKSRPCDNPLIVHIADISQLKLLAEDIPERAYLLAEKFWPGPMTLILKKSSIVPYETSGGLDTVAVRLPADDIARQLIRLSKTAIAAPSANTSGKPSPTLASHVVEDLGGRIDVIIDAGPAEIGLESTIIDVSTSETVILRPGALSLYAVKKIIPDAYRAVYDKKLFKDKKLKPKAPGMKYRHYAPCADILIVKGNCRAVAEKISGLVKDDITKRRRAGIITLEENLQLYDQIRHSACIIVVGSKKDKKSTAHNLFKVLRQFDKAGVDIIYSEAFERDGIGEAVMNRLLKAASYKVIDV